MLTGCHNYAVPPSPHGPSQTYYSVDTTLAASLRKPKDAMKIVYYLLTEPVPKPHYLTNHLYLLTHRHRT